MAKTLGRSLRRLGEYALPEDIAAVREAFRLRRSTMRASKVRPASHRRSRSRKQAVSSSVSTKKK